MNSNDIMVSICCLAYNHEKYIRKCLDGFVMQKTNFKYEVLIHDDASTDSTAEIIREYEKKYPDIIKPIYQTENQYSKGVKINKTYQYPRAVGKYVAMCEGDDYWSDPLKLQKQFDALEENSCCSISTHFVSFIEENGEKTEKTIPGLSYKTNLISREQLIYEMIKARSVPFQLSSFFCRRNFLIEYLDENKFSEKAPVGDVPLLLFLFTKGDCYFIEEEMSCYRINSISSWSVNISGDFEKRIEMAKAMKEMMLGFDEYTNYKYSELIFEYVQWRDFQCANYFERLKNPTFRKYLKAISTKDKIINFCYTLYPRSLKILMFIKGIKNGKGKKTKN